MSDNNKNGTVVFIFLLIFSMCLLFSSMLINGVFVTNVDDRGNVEVSIQDQFTEIVDLKLSIELTDIDLLQNYNVGDRYINITSLNSYIPLPYDSVCLKEDVAFYQAEILSVVSLGGDNYQLELDSPLDFPYTTAGGCSIRSTNMAVDGSVTPVIFGVSPKGLNNVSWDITRVIFSALGDGISGASDVPDDSSFLVTDPITNGIVVRSVDGITKNIFNAKSNHDLRAEGYDLSLTPKSKFGFYGASFRRSFNGPDKNGVTVRLNSETEDTFQIIVQDDLTDMEDFIVIIQGHVVD